MLIKENKIKDEKDFILLQKEYLANENFTSDEPLYHDLLFVS